LPDTVAATFASVVQGVGKAVVLSVVMLVLSYAGMIPIAFVLAFKAGLGIHGLWLAPVISDGAKTLVLAFIANFLVDSEGESKRARALALQDSGASGLATEATTGVQTTEEE
jgi:Na+-driven multidrug efflux pump